MYGRTGYAYFNLLNITSPNVNALGITYICTMYVHNPDIKFEELLII